MQVPLEPRLASSFLVVLVATPLLARLFERRGWSDRGREARKLQGRAVPTVGGLAFTLGLLPCLPLAVAIPAGAPPWVAALTPAPVPLLVTLVLALAVGWIDDRRRDGLSPLAKLGAQLLALLPLALHLASDGRPAAALGLVVLGLVAFNVLNTFDNADGALAAVGCLGFGAAVPAASAALLGFLPWNLDARRRGDGGPTAYLGDAGAHALGGLVLATPLAWGLLWIPALDLARLAWVRWRVGSRPWIGDRRHLAHRLQARGLSPPTVALLLALLAAPALGGWWTALSAGAGLPAFVGLGASAAGFLLALRRAPDASACPDPGASE